MVTHEDSTRTPDGHTARTRPPRARRPPELVRHVIATIEAYRQMLTSRKRARPGTVVPAALDKN
jgi:hypothetical protein